MNSAAKAGLMRSLLLLAGTCALIAVLIYGTPLFTMGGDNTATLLVSESIVTHGTIHLDAFRNVINPNFYGIRQIGGHIYNLYPLGTSLLASPFVLVSVMRGNTMLDHEKMVETARLICMLTSPAIFVLLYLIGRCYLGRTAAYTISAISFFGSAYMSTLGTALWSHNFSVLLCLAALYPLVRFHRGASPTPHPYLVGVLLFMTYFTRPTYSLFILAVFLFLYLRSKSGLLKAAGVSFVLFVMFALFSYMHFGTPLPPYYLQTLGESSPATAAYGILLSPSRGTLVFSPFALVVLAFSAVMFGQLRRDAVFIMALTWVGLHMAVLANWNMWSGGWSYGPRLQIDSFAAFPLLAFTIWDRMETAVDAARAKAAAAMLFLAAGALAIWINTYSGLFNKWTSLWSQYGTPYNQLVYLDWRFPQFIASGESVRGLILAQYPPGQRHVEFNPETYEITDIDTSPFGAEAYFKSMADYALGAGDFDAAALNYTRAIGHAPGNAELYRGRGSAYKALNRPDAAERDFEQARRLGGQ